MNRLFTTAALFTLLGMAAPAQAVNPDAPADSSRIIVPAFLPASVDAPEVQAARDFAQSRIPSLTLVNVNVAYTQVVSGWNVKIITTGVEDGRQVTWKFLVYRKLDGEMSLTLAERL